LGSNEYSASPVRIAAAARFAENANNGLPIKIGARAVRHIDLPEKASITSKINAQVASPSNWTVHPDILYMTIQVDQSNCHHLHVIAIGVEPERPERPIAKPIFRLADVDRVAVNPKSHALLAEENLPSAGLYIVPASVPLRLCGLEQQKKCDRN
jgi:hypothetical protein